VDKEGFEAKKRRPWGSVWRSFGLPEVGLRKVVTKGVRAKDDLGTMPFCHWASKSVSISNIALGVS
jgi:hypothetical protein